MAAKYIYLVAGTGKPLLVELSLLEGLAGGWFWENFGRTSRTTHAAPLPESFRGLPVYGVPTTAGILEEVVHLLRFPQCLAKAKNKVPLALEATVDLDLWKLSLTYFGFNQWNVVADDSDVEDEEETKQAAKRTRLETITTPKRIEFVQEFATALGKQVWTAVLYNSSCPCLSVLALRPLPRKADPREASRLGSLLDGYGARPLVPVPHPLGERRASRERGGHRRQASPGRCPAHFVDRS
jgi:hypothetical protein